MSGDRRIPPPDPAEVVGVGSDRAAEQRHNAMAGGSVIEVHPSRDLLSNGLTLMGSWHYNLNLYPDLMQVIERSDLLDTLISHTLPLTSVQQAFETIASQKSAKVILHPWA